MTGKSCEDGCYFGPQMPTTDGVSENRLGDRRSVHDSLGSQRITLGVADPVGMDVSDFAVIDNCYRQYPWRGFGS